MSPEALKRVVITGLGPVTSIGTGKQEFWKNLLDSRIKSCKIPEQFKKNYKFHSGFYVPFPEIDIADHGFPNKYKILMEETSKLAVVGTKLALEDAGIASTDQRILNNAMVLLGIGICSLKAGFEAFASHTFGANSELLSEHGLSTRFNRMVIPSIMPDSAASWISILFGIQGPNYTINASCASGTYAIGEAYRNIKNGLADIAITGGVECLQDNSGTIMRGFDSLGTLTQSEDGLPRPFSKKRSGFLFAEGGGGILILEELESALKRGVRIYAEIIDYDSCSDAHSLVQIDESGSQIKAMLSKLIKGRKIDYFNAHGTGTMLNDDVEARIIQSLFGEEPGQPLINSTKGILGHTIGASGAIEAIVSVLSIKNSTIHANLTEDTIDNLNLPSENINKQIHLALSPSYGFGGHNAAILFKNI